MQRDADAAVSPYIREISLFSNVRMWRKFAHICPSLYGCSEGICFSATGRVLSSFVFKIRVVWPEKQSEQVGDYIFWSRSAIVTCVLLRTPKKKCILSQGARRRFQLDDVTATLIYLWKRLFVRSTLKCCFKLLVLLYVESMLVTLLIYKICLYYHE